MKKVGACVLIFLLMFASSLIKVEALLASTDKNMEETMDSGEAQSEDQAIEEGSDDQGSEDEEGLDEEAPDTEYELPSGDENSTDGEGDRS